MKEKKVNMKSIRFTDTIKDIIESQEGNGFNEKFENLILECTKKLPEIKESIEYHKEIIKDQKQKIKEMDNLIITLNDINKYVKYAINETKKY